MRFTVALMVFLFAGPASAQQEVYPIWDFGKRIQASAQVGGLVFSEVGLETPNWKGADVGAALTYSIHGRFSLYALYDHGFPAQQIDGHRNFLRAAANLRVYPGPSAVPGNTNIAIGGGAAWLGRDDLKAWKGLEGHIAVARIFAPSWALYGMYSHGFATNAAESDLDFGRLGIARKVWP